MKEFETLTKSEIKKVNKAGNGRIGEYYTKNDIIKGRNKMIIVTWSRTTTAGGKEFNYFYCDTMEEAEQFRKECEAVNGNEVYTAVEI